MGYPPFSSAYTGLPGGLTILPLPVLALSCVILKRGRGRNRASHHVSAENHLSLPFRREGRTLERRKFGVDEEDKRGRWEVAESGNLLSKGAEIGSVRCFSSGESTATDGNVYA